MFNELLNLSKLSIKSVLSRQTLERTPEPDSVTVDDDAVFQFTGVDTSTYALLYGLLLDFLYRIRPLPKNGNSTAALELGSGPGTCASLVSKYLRYEKIVGVDLSEPMIEVARKKIIDLHLDHRVEFRKSDITKLTECKNESFDLVYSLNVLHHLPSLDLVRQSLLEADRTCKPDGLILISDMQRPKTKSIANAYLDWLGPEVKKRGLNAHYQDFFNSVFAAWTAEEFISVIPNNGKRRWYHLQPYGFSPQQLIIAVPKTQTQLFLRAGISEELEKTLIPSEYKDLWRMTLRAFNFSKVRNIINEVDN